MSQREALKRGPISMAAGDRAEPLANPTRLASRGAKMGRKLIVVLASLLVSLAAAGPVAGDHGGPHEQRLPDAACNDGTAMARAGAPGAPTEDPRRRIPHEHTLIIEGQQESGCYHFNEQFPPAEILS